MAAIKRKQLKRTYKIPRSLKKCIKKNLAKIVKKCEQEHDEDCYHYQLFHSKVSRHLSNIGDIWEEYTTRNALRDALETPLHRIFYSLGSENARPEGGLSAQKDFARRLLKMRKESGILQAEIRFWLFEQGDDMNEVEKLGKEEEEQAKEKNEAEDKDNQLETTEEYDWTSTSTLE